MTTAKKVMQNLEERQSWLAERTHMFANISVYIAIYIYFPPIIITIMAMIWLLPAGSNDIYWLSMFKIPLVILNPLIVVFYSHSVIATSIQLRSHVRPERHIISDVRSARKFVQAIWFIEIIAFVAEVAELIWRIVRFATGGFPDSDQGYSLSLTFIVITAYALFGITIDIFLNGFSWISYLKEIQDYLEAAALSPTKSVSPYENEPLLQQPASRAPAPPPIVAEATSSHYSDDDAPYERPARQRRKVPVSQSMRGSAGGSLFGGMDVEDDYD